MKWKVFFASAAGKHHLDNQVPCQDAGHHAVIGDVLIGVVCDGAGSASHGQLGSASFATKVTELLAAAVRGGGLAADGRGDFGSLLLPALREARAQVDDTARARQLELRDLACTLVGCIAWPGGGWFFHIGDGFAIHTSGAGESVLSHPENGEYSDETYFVTDEAWEDHLRVTPIGATGRGCLIGLMSDGTAPFAVDRPRTGFYGPFIDPVVAFLSDASEHVGNQALKNLLESEKTFDITHDDKALLLALAH